MEYKTTYNVILLYLNILWLWAKKYFHLTYYRLEQTTSKYWDELNNIADFYDLKEITFEVLFSRCVYFWENHRIEDLSCILVTHLKAFVEQRERRPGLQIDD